MVAGDIHDEVLGHNCLLDRMGNNMDASRDFLSGTVNRFKMDAEERELAARLWAMTGIAEREVLDVDDHAHQNPLILTKFTSIS
ncbi:hypothetical protein Droror1_Dr00009885 [Drosera rotundifolia]